MEFKFTLKVKNLGRIKQAEIALNSFTVFAGHNNTGKSYVSRFLYSLLDSLNMNLTHAYLERMSKNLEESIPALRANIRVIGKIHAEYRGKSTAANDILDRIFDLKYRVEEFADAVKSELRKVDGNGAANGSSNGAQDIIRGYVKSVSRELDNIEEIYNQQAVNFEAGEITQPSDKSGYLAAAGAFKRAVKTAKESCRNLVDLDAATKQADSIKQTYEYILAYNLLGNFQIKSLANLIGRDKSAAAIIELGIPGSKERKISCTIKPDAEEVLLDYGEDQSILGFLKDFSRVIYLESPLYWKLEKPLEESRFVPMRFISDDQDDFLGGVPKYFMDLEYAMKYPRKGRPKIDFDVERIVGGRIIRDRREVLVYKENESGIEYPLTSTATGVIQLAFISYLVETQIIKNDAVIFIDEPEAHLHPKWQRIMMNSLGSLMQQGVNVVFATHSPDNVQWLKAEMNQADDFEDKLAINHFTADGEFNAAPPREVCPGILRDLTDSFAKEYFRSAT